MPHDDRAGGVCTADGQIKIQQVAAGIFGGEHGRPAGCRLPAQDGVSTRVVARALVLAISAALERAEPAVLGETEQAFPVRIERSERLARRLGDEPPLDRELGYCLRHESTHTKEPCLPARLRPSARLTGAKCSPARVVECQRRRGMGTSGATEGGCLVDPAATPPQGLAQLKLAASSMLPWPP